MYPSLSEGSIEKITKGIDVDRPVLQILGHKRVSSSSSPERYRLLLSDGKRVNSFTMLATQLNYLITDNVLTEFSICQVTKYATSMVMNNGKKKRVMIVLAIDLKVPGNEVGKKIGNPTHVDTTQDADDNAQDQTNNTMQNSSAHTYNVVQDSSSMQKLNPNQIKMEHSSDITTTPIAALSPYQNRWVIKARVTNKSDIRTWSNSRGEGKLFSMDLLDDSGEIRCTAFRDACDKFFDMIEVGKVYYISRCTMKSANKQFSTLNNDYEMTIANDTEIFPCNEEAADIPNIQFNFQPITEVENKQKNDFIDILGIVKSYGDIQNLTARTTGRDLKKRDINLVDETNTMVTLTLWGTQAEEFDGTNNPVLAIKGARIGEFNGGKNLSCVRSSVVQIDPDIPEAHKLRGWFNTIGQSEESKSISRALGNAGGMTGELITFKEADEMKLGYQENADFYIVKATVNMIRTENAVYKACPTENCNKKMVDQSNGMYRCEKCNREYSNYKYRLLASANFADWTDNKWITAFNEEAEKILNISVQDLGKLQEEDNDAYLEVFGNATFKSYMFKMKTKMECFNDESRLRTTCVSVMPLDYKAYNDNLLTKIKEMIGMTKI